MLGLMVQLGLGYWENFPSPQVALADPRDVFAEKQYAPMKEVVEFKLPWKNYVILQFSISGLHCQEQGTQDRRVCTAGAF